MNPLTRDTTAAVRPLAAALLLALCSLCQAQPAPKVALPEFRVPGHESEMNRLNQLLRLHYYFNSGQAGGCTLWDCWMTHASLWAQAGDAASAQALRDAWGRNLQARRIDPEGYVAMQQHRGMAHNDGWPFPAWQQAGGAGWFFSTHDEVYGVGMFNLKPLTTTEGWEIAGASVEGIDPVAGLQLRATNALVTVTTPPFACGTVVAPFARLEWAAQELSGDCRPNVAWQLQGDPSWKTHAGAAFPALTKADGMRFAHVPLYRIPGYDGILTRYRLVFDHAAGARLTLKSLITCIDSRHPSTNPVYLQGCTEYFNWTGDTNFLQANMDRMRRALRFALDEFGVLELKHVRVPWVGHDGRSGLVLAADGKKKIRVGLGVGNNYWDLLPFGGHDTLATIYLYDALLRMSALEQEIRTHPEWRVPSGKPPFEPAELTQLADAIKSQGGQFFWNEREGRFIGWQDLEGERYDHGYTFVNLEAIYLGFATDEQARRIMDWLDGRRLVAGDTSQGADIYRWRFGPRATTRRNIETYVWAWSAPEHTPWGGQVQDGGAVLGFTYFDLMARLRTRGPDNARKRLDEILAWFDEVQQAGGYRSYYTNGMRGTSLQGCNTAGGLGIDCEFMESALVPQIMLHGFLGCEPRPGGLRLAPRLPAGWPELTVTRLFVQGHVLDITARPDGLEIVARQTCDRELRLWLPAGQWDILNGSNRSTGRLRTADDFIRLELKPGRPVILRR